MKYIYQLRNYANGLPPAGRLFYAILSYFLDTVIALFIVEAMGGGPKWETIVILLITLAYATCIDMIWQWIEG